MWITARVHSLRSDIAQYANGLVREFKPDIRLSSGQSERCIYWLNRWEVLNAWTIAMVCTLGCIRGTGPGTQHSYGTTITISATIAFKFRRQANLRSAPFQILPSCVTWCTGPTPFRMRGSWEPLMSSIHSLLAYSTTLSHPSNLFLFFCFFWRRGGKGGGRHHTAKNKLLF